MTTHGPPTARGIRLAPLIAIAFSTALVAGLLVGYLKHQVHVLSTQRVALEREMRDLKAKADVNESTITTLTSRAALQLRLNEGALKLVPIKTDRIVRIPAVGSRPADSVVMAAPLNPPTTLRPISNVRLR